MNIDTLPRLRPLTVPGNDDAHVVRAELLCPHCSRYVWIEFSLEYAVHCTQPWMQLVFWHQTLSAAAAITVPDQPDAP